MIKTIVMALDGSDLSEKVIGALEKLEIKPATKIILSHVLPAPETDADIAPDRPHQSFDALYQDIEKKLQSLQLELQNSQIEIVSGDPAEEIIRLANIHHADLIVIGNRGLTGFKRVIEGSVSSQVVADAPCSVLVVK